MSAGPSRRFGSPAPQWSVLPEPSPSAVLSDDDLTSTQDMRDELEPTPPASQPTPLPRKKRKPDVPASEDERAAGNKLLKKPKVPTATGGGERTGQIGSVPVPSPASQGPPASPLDAYRPRKQLAMKRSRGRPLNFQYERARDLPISQPATTSAPAPPERTTATSMQPPPSISPSAPFAKSRLPVKNSSWGDASRREVPATQPAGGAKGKEIDRSGVAGGSGARWTTKKTSIPASGGVSDESDVSINSKRPVSASKDPKAPASTPASRKPQASYPFDFFAPKPKGPPKKNIDASASSAKVGTINKPGPKSASQTTYSRPVASSSKAGLAPLSVAQSKKRSLFATSSSSSDESTGPVAPSRVPDGRSQRKSMGLTKVPIPRAGARNAQTGRRDSDSSVSAEEFPARRKKKKIKLTQVEKRADISTASSLTATQQRRKSAVVPSKAAITSKTEVIELSSDSDLPEPPKAPLARAKQPRASAPADPDGVINITDTEDEAPPPPRGTQSQMTLELKYDADGSILIDDDDDDEPAEAPVPLPMPKVEKPISTAARDQLTWAAADDAGPSGQDAEVEEQIQHIEESVDAQEEPDDVVIEEQMQGLDLGNQPDVSSHDSPEAVEDVGLLEEPEVEPMQSVPQSASPTSEDADLALSTNTQLHIATEDHDEAAGPVASSPERDGNTQAMSTPSSGVMSARAMEKAPARLTQSPSFTTVLSTGQGQTGDPRQTASPERISQKALVHPTPSVWIAPLSPSIGKSSKVVYGGASGFFKDVYASRRKSRSTSGSVRELTVASKVHMEDVASPDPGAAASSPQVTASSPIREIPLAHEDMRTGEEVDSASSFGGLELAYPSSRSISRPSNSKSRSPSAHMSDSAEEAPSHEIAVETNLVPQEEAGPDQSEAESSGPRANARATSAMTSPTPAPFRTKPQTSERASLAEVINSVWLERTEVIDLTLDDDDDDDDDARGIQTVPTVSSSEVTKSEAMSPPISTVGKSNVANIDLPPTDEVSASCSPGPSAESTTVAERRSLDSLQSMHVRHPQKHASDSETMAGTSVVRSERPSRVSPGSHGKQTSAENELSTEGGHDQPQSNLFSGRIVHAVVEEQDSSEEDVPIIHLKQRSRSKAARFEESGYPPTSPSPSQGEDSEQEIASYLDIAEVEVSNGPASSEAGPSTRQLRPRNKSRSTAPSGDSRRASRSRRSTSTNSSSVGPVELSDEFDPTFAEPRIASPSDEPEWQPTTLELVAKKAGFQSLSWQKDHRRIMKEFANYYVLAKDLPHELQDQINALHPRARKEGDMQVKLFEQAIIENTFEDEPHAPPICIVNDIDDELTPPFEFHYSNLMWHGSGVPKPDIVNLRGCGCLGPCDPNSKTCSCLARQKEHHPDGFLYQEGRNKGQLKAHGYPIFECNDFCGCSDDCSNRVVQHGRRYAIEIRKTRHKGWGVFAGPKRIPKNTYLGIYAGEYLMEAEAEVRGIIYNKFGRTYLFDVDFYYLREGKDDWSSQYSVDAYHAGNFTRYLNHSCDPNCHINPVYINEANLDKPLLTIFTLKDVAPGEELCFSYYGTDDDEEEVQNMVEARNFDDAVYVKCQCGARNCKGRMWRE